MKLGLTFISADHELSCLTYEEALKQGLETECGGNAADGYWVEIRDCSVLVFAEILIAAEALLTAAPTCIRTERGKSATTEEEVNQATTQKL